MNWKTVAIMSVCFLLLACGNKGPLVLPDAGDDNKEKAGLTK